MTYLATFEEMLDANPKLKGTAFSALRSWGYTPQEAHQEALIGLWEISKSDAQPENASAWLHVVLRRKEIDKSRRLESRARRDSGIELPAPDTGEKVLAEELASFIGELPEEDAELLLMTYLAGFTRRELAEKFGIPIGTVKSRVSRVCGKLKKRLEIVNG